MTAPSPMLAPAPGTTPVPGPGATTGSLIFYLGTHHPGWLRTVTIPLFVSDRRLRVYKTLPRANTSWALDSGGFTELSSYGTWDHGQTPRQYATRIRRYRDEIGNLQWAAPQDWMCEPFITARTGLSVADHQRRTVDNLIRLRSLDPDLPVIPVLQGWTIADYLRCADLYEHSGINLAAERLVGLGSVCRRQATSEVQALVMALHARGITRLHGFGVKIHGLAHCGHLLTSADSLAWSFAARRQPPLPGCETRHINCANCPRYAYQWYARVRACLALPRYTQLTLFGAEGGAA